MAQPKQSEQKPTTLQQATKDSSQLLSKESKRLSQERIKRELTQTAQNKKMQPVSEALSAVQDTRNAVDLLNRLNANEARMALERAWGKIEKVMTNYPQVALIPISSNVSIIDTFADEDSIDTITNEVRDMVNHGRFQPARLILREFASEIEAVTLNLPILTYPDAIRSASRMLEHGKIEETAGVLFTALRSLVILEQHIPLPLLRAQALIDEVSRYVSEGEINKDRVAQFLKDAEQQLSLADKIGYGKRKEDFKKLHDTIKKVKDSIRQDQESKGLLATLKKGMQALKEQIGGTREEVIEKELKAKKLAA